MARRPESGPARRKHAGVGREGLREGEGRPADDPTASAGVGYGGLDADPNADGAAAAGRGEADAGLEDEPGAAILEDPVDLASFDSMDASDAPSGTVSRVGPAKRPRRRS